MSTAAGRLELRRQCLISDSRGGGSITEIILKIWFGKIKSIVSSNYCERSSRNQEGV